MDLISHLLHEVRILAEPFSLSSLTAHFYHETRFNQSGHFPQVRFQLTFQNICFESAHTEMGCPQQRERDRKKASKSCQKLDSFFVSKRRKLSSTDEHEDDMYSIDSGEESRSESPSSSAVSFSKKSSSSTSTDSANGNTTTTNLPVTDPQTELQVALPTTSSQQIDVVQSPIITDISKIVELSSKDLDAAIRKLTPEEKYTLLKHHKSPSASHVFSTTFLGGCNRSFLVSWLDNHPWMVYSECLDGAFCVPCVLFCQNRAGKGHFVNNPFRSWHKKSEKCKTHETSQYHQEALCLADSFLRSVESPETTTVAMLEKRKMENIERNRAILKSITEAIVFCGRQCIALRGDT